MEEIGHILPHVIEHSLKDTIYLVPFLFLTYVLMEWLEHRTGTKTQDAIKRAGAAGPIVGALLGVVPQCGFSAAAATLWAGRVVTFGTLIAVFLATSDEMIPVFVAEGAPLSTILSILGAKVVIGMLMGLIVDAVLRIIRRERAGFRIHELCEHDGCHCSEGVDCSECNRNPESVYEHFQAAVDAREARVDASDLAQATEPSGLLGDAVSEHESHAVGHDGDLERAHDHGHHDHNHDHGHGHSHEHGAGWKDIFRSALVHTVQVTVFIFIITFVLDGALEIVGEDAIADILSSNPTFAVLVAALVGLIPNCAASVAIAQLFLDGVLGSGAMLAGLLAAAGVGLLVMFRTNRHWKQNVTVVVLLYAIAVFWGLMCNAFGVVF